MTQTTTEAGLAADLRAGVRKVKALREVAGLRGANLTTLNRLQETAERAADALEARALSQSPAPEGGVRVGGFAKTIKGANFWGRVVALYEIAPGEWRADVLAVADGFAGTLHVYPVKQLIAILEPTPEAMAVDREKIVEVRETGWLIELKPSVVTTPVWFQLVSDDDWTSDASKALRFARKQDAEAYIESVGWTGAFSSEHEWSDPPLLGSKQP